jgi:hypothetical protein
MATKEDIRPLSHIAPKEHADREGASMHSGFQPASKFANTGSTPEETEITKRQRE